MGARRSPFPAGLGLDFRLGLLGLGAIATVLRGFGAVCDLVFIRQGKPLSSMRVELGGLREVWGRQEARRQERGERQPDEREEMGAGGDAETGKGKTRWPRSSALRLSWAGRVTQATSP